MYVHLSKTTKMRYKSQILNKIELISGTIANIEIATNQGDKPKLYSIAETLKEQLEDIRQFLDIENDEFGQQFK